MKILMSLDWGSQLNVIFHTYLILTLIYFVIAILKMVAVEHKCDDIMLGRNRVSELKAKGKFKQMPVYSMVEMSKNRNKEFVRLTFFPADHPKHNRFVLVLPGGGYAHTMVLEEGLPTAAKLNKLGYNAFVLEYRTGFHCSEYAPMEDVAAAIRYIENRQDEFNVTIDNYGIIGYSAGGNLACNFGSPIHSHGYKALGVERPGFVVMGYPWVRVSHTREIPHWNVWIGLLAAWLSVRGYFYMFGLRITVDKMASLDLMNAICEDYPQAYLFAGSFDALVPTGWHADMLASLMEKKKMNFIYRKFYGLPHGIGIAKGTIAEGWLEEAMDFWETKEKNTEGSYSHIEHLNAYS